MIPGTVYRSSVIYHKAKENLSLGNSLTKAVRSVIASNGVRYFKMAVDPQHVREGNETMGKE